jgi:hypothetical protein
VLACAMRATHSKRRTSHGAEHRTQQILAIRLALGRRRVRAAFETR